MPQSDRRRSSGDIASVDIRKVPDDELRRLPVLAGLSDEQLARVRRAARLVELAEGEHLFEHGQRAERFFMLREGRIKLYRLSPEGDEKVIEIIRPGQSFAEAVMFMEGKRYPVSAQALVRSELVAFDNSVFLQILRESVETCFRVMAAMSMRLRARVNEIEALALQNATLRLVNYLLGELPEDAGESAEIRLPAPKNVIASRLSVQPETLSRILHQLCDKGLITVQGRTITVHDVPALRRYGGIA